MKPELIERLSQINREFYATFAGAFSETRPESARDLDRILPYIAHGARVLDIGCGNGRVAERLASLQREVTFVGLDWSEQMVEIARTASRQPSLFIVADILQPDWRCSLPGGTQAVEMFDSVLMLAVLHHIPGFSVRARILGQVRELLAERGCIVVSTWQFLENERMRRKIVPWSAIGIDERELEPGDVLLDWKRGGTGLRYCHWAGENEIRKLAAQAGLAVTETFQAGGREGNLSLYAVLSRP